MLWFVTQKVVILLIFSPLLCSAYWYWNGWMWKCKLYGCSTLVGVVVCYGNICNCQHFRSIQYIALQAGCGNISYTDVLLLLLLLLFIFVMRISVIVNIFRSIQSIVLWAGCGNVSYTDVLVLLLLFIFGHEDIHNCQHV